MSLVSSDFVAPTSTERLPAHCQSGPRTTSPTLVYRPAPARKPRTTEAVHHPASPASVIARLQAVAAQKKAEACSDLQLFDAMALHTS